MQQCKERLEAYLRENGVAYQTHHHPLAYTAQEIAAAEHMPGKMLAKVVIVKVDDGTAMLVLPASYKIDLDKARSVLGARDVRLAREEEFVGLFSDCEVGAMPAFGNLYGVPVYVDRALAEDESIGMQAGSHTDTISLRYADFERLVRPAVAEFAVHL